MTSGTRRLEEKKLYESRDEYRWDAACMPLDTAVKRLNEFATPNRMRSLYSFRYVFERHYPIHLIAYPVVCIREISHTGGPQT